MDPTCPSGYKCTFTPPKAPEFHHLGPWWEGTWGVIIAILIIAALVTIMYLLCESWVERRKVKLMHEDRQRIREHDLLMAEQKTMQLDMQSPREKVR